MGIYAFSYLANWVSRCLSSYLTALGKAVQSFTTSICGTLIFPLLCLTILAPTKGFDGVCLMPLLAGILSGALAIILSIPLKLDKAAL